MTVHALINNFLSLEKWYLISFLLMFPHKLSLVNALMGMETLSISFAQTYQLIELIFQIRLLHELVADKHVHKAYKKIS